MEKRVGHRGTSLTRKCHPPPRTTVGPQVLSYGRALGGGILMREEPL
jgi:hypothetical protein